MSLQITLACSPLTAKHDTSSCTDQVTSSRQAAHATARKVELVLQTRTIAPADVQVLADCCMPCNSREQRLTALQGAHYFGMSLPCKLSCGGLIQHCCGYSGCLQRVCVVLQSNFHRVRAPNVGEYQKQRCSIVSQHPPDPRCCYNLVLSAFH